MSHSLSMLVTVAGPDHPGITSSLLEIIDELNHSILDMGQAVTHGLLSLSILIDTTVTQAEEDGLLKELLFVSTKKGLNLTYQEIPTEGASSLYTNGEQFILNCVTTDSLGVGFIKDLAHKLADYNINILRIDNMTPGNFKTLEISTVIPVDLDFSAVKKDLIDISNRHQVDMAFLKDNVFRRSKRLIVFDMDSTLIQTEVIDEMADACGAGDKVREITERAMNGELNFDESLNERVALLKGLTTEKMQTILENLPLTPGTEEFIQTVKNLGYKVALISGGFTFFAEALKEKLGLDYAFANELKIIDKKLTGEVVGQIINGEQKAFLLKVIAQQEKISLEQVVAIGDGANDLHMLSAAGLGIAFHAKDIVRQKAQNHMSHGPMTSILYFLGIPGPFQNT